MIIFLKKYFKYILLFVWVVLIFILSNEPAAVSSSRSDQTVDIISKIFDVGLIDASFLTFLIRKFAHIFMFFVLGVLVYVAVYDKRLLSKRVFLSSIGVSLLLAISDEIHQLFVVGRSCELRDIVIDFIASSIGVLAVHTVLRLRHTYLLNKL